MNQFQGQSRETGRLHLLLGAVFAGIVLFILLEVIVQLLPPHYSALSQSESDLAVGPYGFLMAIAFAIAGVTYLVFIMAFSRTIPKEAQSRTGLILLGVAAAGKFIIAFANTDLTPRPETIHGAIHALAAVISFICEGSGFLLLARALRRDSYVRPPAGVLLGLASVVLAWAVIVLGTLAVSSQIAVWGLLERILTALFFLWVILVSLGLWRSPSREGAPGQRTFQVSKEIVSRR